jgi:hypothetical protein
MTSNTAFGVSTPINSRSINNAFDAVLNNGYDFSNIVATGSITAAGLITSATGFSGNGANLTALNASNLASGTVPTARISGSYTGITGVGTLTVGAIPASLLTGTTLPSSIVASSLTSVGTITSGTWSGSFGAVSGANLTSLNASNISSGTLANARLPAAATTITSVGTLTALTSSGRIHAQTDLRVGNTNSAVLSSNQFRLIVTPQAYTSYGVELGEFYSSSGIYSASSNFNIGASTTTSFINPANGNTAAYITNVDGEYYGRSNIRIFTAGANFIAQSPTTSSGNAAQWLSVFGLYILVRNTSTRNDKENIQPLNGIVTPSMIDDIDISLWNRKGATGFPEIGPMAEDMDEVSPFLSIRGMDCDEEGNIVATEPTGINQNSWLSLLTLSVQDIRTRLAELEAA